MGRAVTVAEVRRAVTSLVPRADADVPKERKAAVAAVFREQREGAELLLIRRAEHPRDPWSGHMAFPGGRVNVDDRDPLAAAVRETREELSLDLQTAGDLVGRLSEVHTHLAPTAVPRAVVPFVFELRAVDAVLTANHEVQESIWVPLAFILDRSNRSSMTWLRRGLPLPLPCYRYDGRVIWGLTLRIVDELVDALG